MRKQPRSRASLAMLTCAATLAATGSILSPDPASAHRVRRSAAPPTAENFTRLRHCESGGDYSINSGNSYFGAYQFSVPTWESLGYNGLPSDAAPEVQDEAAHRLYDRSGWRPWPGCARQLRLR